MDISRRFGPGRAQVRFDVRKPGNRYRLCSARHHHAGPGERARCSVKRTRRVIVWVIRSSKTCWRSGPISTSGNSARRRTVPVRPSSRRNQHAIWSAEIRKSCSAIRRNVRPDRRSTSEDSGATADYGGVACKLIAGIGSLRLQYATLPSSAPLRISKETTYSRKDKHEIETAFIVSGTRDLGLPANSSGRFIYVYKYQCSKCERRYRRYFRPWNQ